MTRGEFCPDFADLRHPGGAYEEYGRFQQHLGLIEDSARLLNYQVAIAAAGPGDIVVDVGAGTGVLSLIALKSGYERAILIEPSKKILEYAKYLVALNGFASRCSFVHGTLEQLTDSQLPDTIDMVVSETISSVIVGFGSWDAIGRLCARLSPSGVVIPSNGVVYGFFSEQELWSRSPSGAGVPALKAMGIDMDLHLRTFRSGGNIFDKATINYDLAMGKYEVVRLLSFDCRNKPVVTDEDSRCISTRTTIYLGFVAFWEVILNHSNPCLKLCSRDPRLTSWYPFYIPFHAPLRVQEGQVLRPRLTMLAVDAPYKYAFRLCDGETPLTNVLYW